MTPEERLEMLHLSIESVYREHFRHFGPTWRKYLEDPDLEGLWGQVEALERQIGVVK